MGEDGFEVLYGSEGYDVGTGEAGAGGENFGSIGYYIDVGQCKCAGHFAEEGGLLVVRFDQRQVDVRGLDFQGKGGESGAGADVENAWRIRVRGENSLRQHGRGGRVGVLRLRQALRFALGSATLRMTRD